MKITDVATREQSIVNSALCLLDDKDWYRSKTMLGLAMLALAWLLRLRGVAVPPIVDVFGWTLAVYGRAKAKKQIKRPGKRRAKKLPAKPPATEKQGGKL